MFEILTNVAFLPSIRCKLPVVKIMPLASGNVVCKTTSFVVLGISHPTLIFVVNEFLNSPPKMRTFSVKLPLNETVLFDEFPIKISPCTTISSAKDKLVIVPFISNIVLVVSIVPFV